LAIILFSFLRILRNCGDGGHLYNELPIPNNNGSQLVPISTAIGNPDHSIPISSPDEISDGNEEEQEARTACLEKYGATIQRVKNISKDIKKSWNNRPFRFSMRCLCIIPDSGNLSM
ncbi:hypothetical protein KI387_017909, partial [Taxus chinensis]